MCHVFRDFLDSIASYLPPWWISWRSRPPAMKQVTSSIIFMSAPMTKSFKTGHRYPLTLQDPAPRGCIKFHFSSSKLHSLNGFLLLIQYSTEEIKRPSLPAASSRRKYPKRPCRFWRREHAQKLSLMALFKVEGKRILTLSCNSKPQLVSIKTENESW